MVDHVEPRLVAASATGRRPQGVGLPLAQPHVDVEVVALLGPEHPRQRLPHHGLGVLFHRRWRDGVVELVSLGATHRDVLVGAGERCSQLLGSGTGQTDTGGGAPA